MKALRIKGSFGTFDAVHERFQKWKSLGYVRLVSVSERIVHDKIVFDYEMIFNLPGWANGESFEPIELPKQEEQSS